MEKIAIISDIHGNLEALQSVILDIKKRGIKRIFCIGDIVSKGRFSNECVDIIKNNCEIVLQGNCDYYFTSNHDKVMKDGSEKDYFLWNKNNISVKNREYLSNLPYCYEMMVSGRLVRLFHGTPTVINGFVSSIDPVDKLYSQFLPSDKTISDKTADVVIYAHIHSPFMQKLYNRYLINIGSVGNSLDIIRNKERDANVKNTSVANYFILSGNIGSYDYSDNISYEFISVHYNVSLELEKSKDIMGYDYYKNELINGVYRNMKRVNADFVKSGIDISRF